MRLYGLGARSYLALVVGMAGLSGCASATTGTPMESNQIAQIKKGVTTRKEIFQIFGDPENEIEMPGNRKVLFYQSMAYKGDSETIMFIPIVGPFIPHDDKSSTRQQLLRITLNANDVVEDYDFTDKTHDTVVHMVPFGAHAVGKTINKVPDTEPSH